MFTPTSPDNSQLRPDDNRPFREQIESLRRELLAACGGLEGLRRMDAEWLEDQLKPNPLFDRLRGHQQCSGSPRSVRPPLSSSRRTPCASRTAPDGRTER